MIIKCGGQKSKNLHSMDMDSYKLVLAIISTVFAVKLIAEWLYSGAFYLHKSAPIAKTCPSISIVICARNEEDNLIAHLPKVLEQDYPNFEVVVVNDRSIDDTQLVLRAFKNKYSHLKTTQVNETELHWAGKKFALSIGLKSASNDLVLLTDADCYPSSDQWLKEMASNFSPRNKIVLGYGAYAGQPGLLNSIIRFEALYMAIQYMGLCKLGIPYMGVGRNLAYDKTLFFDNRGFASHQFLPSGDDDLFVNENASNKNSTIHFSKNAYTISSSETTWGGYIQQKRRHLTTSNLYRFNSVFTLLFLSLVKYSFYIVTIICLVLFPEWYWIPLSAILMNMVSQFFQFYFAAKASQAISVLGIVPFGEIFLLLFYPFLFIWNTVISGNPWRNY